MAERMHNLVAIVPCTHVSKSRVFYERLGFTDASGDEAYLMLSDTLGGEVHLLADQTGWLQPGRNPFGLYLYTEGVDGFAALFRDEIIEKRKTPEHKPWGMYEFSLSDPDGTLVRVGWPSRLRSCSGDPAD